MNKKFKVMDQRPHVSDEEIKNFMDFKTVLTQHDKQINMMKRTSLIKKVIVSSVVVVIVASVFWMMPNDDQSNVQQSSIKVDKESGTTSETNIQPVQPTEAGSQKQHEDLSSPKEKAQASDVKNDNIESKPEISPAVADEEKSGSESYVQAEPVKGYQELYDYFSRNLIYPQEMMKDSIQGVSTVSFVIGKDGKPGKIEVMNSLGPAFDKEILRLIESMSEWKAAVLNGKPVPSKISLPVTFQIQKIKAR